MQNIYVNAIYKDNEINIGIVVLDKTVMKNLPILFTGGHTLNNIKLLITKTKEDFYLIFRYCQFVAIFQRNVLGLTLKLYDFEGSMDKALDEYISLSKNNWRKEDKDRIMEVVQEIKNKPGELSKMIIEDEVPLPFS